MIAVQRTAESTEWLP